MADQPTFDVVVIGGGISGLTTAHYLKKRDNSLRVVVLEAKNRVGGRTQTVPLKSASGTDKWDIGGQWVGRCQPHIMGLLEELGLETHPQYLTGKKIQQLGGPKITTYSGDLPSLSLFSLLDLKRFISKIEKLRKNVDPEDPYAHSKAEEWDSFSAQHFFHENLHSQGALDAIESANRTIFGTESSQISFLFWLMYLNAANGIHKICEAKEFTAQEATIKGGAQQISELLVSCIGEDSVRLSQPVVSLQQDENGVTVLTRSGTSYYAKYAVLALPPPLMEFIQFDPPLPEMKRQLCKRMALGNYIKIILTYSVAFWRKNGYSGEVVTNGGVTQQSNCSSGPVCVLYDGCLSNGSPALLGFIAGDIKVEWAEQTPELRKKAVLGQLSGYFGEGIHTYLLDYIEKDWNHEPFSLGGPVCTVPPGCMPLFAKAIRHPIERLHFAGTETATEWCGYMNGAVQAGIRAAFEVLETLHPHALSQEDREVLRASTSATMPPYGLSKSRGSMQQYSRIETSILKWTIGLSVLVGITFYLYRNGKLFTPLK